MNYQILWLVLLIAFAGIEGSRRGWFPFGSARAAWWRSLPLGWGRPFRCRLVCSRWSLWLPWRSSVPWPEKWLHPKMEKTNADRILGQEGVVVESIDNLSASGQVKIDGAAWARSAGDEIIPAGTRIQVERIEGVKAIVIRKET